MPYIFVLLIILLVTVFFARREKPKIPYNRMQATDKETVAKLICDVCVRSKIVNNGMGINPASLMTKIHTANKVILQKIKNGEIITEAEKWLYENFYLLYRYVYMRKDDLKNLPHINGVPRIVVISKIIINNSKNCLTGERVRYILEQTNDRVYLGYNELRQLNNALMYSLTEQAYILADRLLRQDYMTKSAKKFNIRHLDSDVYVYNLYKFANLSDKEKTYLTKRGITQKKATVNYNNTILYNSEVAKTVFTGLREVASFVSPDQSIKYLGAYKILSNEFNLENISVNTLRDYFSVISDVAMTTGADEDYVAEKTAELAKNNNLDISMILFDYKRELKNTVKSGNVTKLKKKTKIFRQYFYSWGIIVMALVCAVCTGVFFNVIAGILSFIPYIFIAENLLNYALTFVAENRNPPEMNYTKVPYNHRVAVVVSEFISSMGQFKESFCNIKKLRASNGGQNIEFCLLVDTKGGNLPVNELDNEIREFLADKMEEDICVFVRNKEFIGGKYCGKERKRGAINALNRYFVTGSSEEFYYISNKNLFTPKYIVTLDADNALITGDVTEMVNIFAHPYNDNYDLLALHSRYNLYSLKTKYSMRFANECGLEEYPVYSDLFFRLFGRDIYCGKGIYKLKEFYKKIDGIFPSEKILSHDIIEGTVLKTGGGTTILEDAPRGFISDRERKKRWMRGDIQLIPFISGKWKTDEKQLYSNKNEPLYKYIMLRNVISVLKPTVILSVLIYGLAFSLPVLLFGIGLFIFSYIIDGIKILRAVALGVRIRYIVADLWKKTKNSLEEFFLVWYYAVDNLLIFVSTCIKMIKNRNLLNWKTYHDSQSDAKASEFAKEFSIPFCVMTALNIGLYFFSDKAIFLSAYLLLSLIFLVELYLSSKIKIQSKKINKETEEKLIRYAEKTFKYFKYMQNDEGLIGDNLQIKPYKGIATITSPTNIGFSLLAQICGFELGIIPLEECLNNMNNIIKKVEKLPKWKGNLYNWYDIDKLQPINAFVSSVDSGNFLACLIVCREFFAKHGDSVGELTTELLILNTNINALYDENKNMFFIGFDGKKYVGHYDILNSESRILTTIFMAYEKNIKNYRCLQRDYSKYNGNTLLSWSGTAFETLMPAIFIKSPINSVIYKTERNVSKAQSRKKINGVWGIGESGQYVFDENLKYQYYAFGLRNLSLKNEPTLPVVSPYSSALCIDHRCKKVIDNFEQIEKIGGLGEYGFFEAIDMRENKNIVSSYMTHHQGMFLCAITNYLKGDVIREYFRKDEKINAVLENYNENISKCNIAYYLNEKRQKSTLANNNYYKNITKLEEYFQVFALNDIDYSVFINSFGGGFSKNGNVLLNKKTDIYEENCGSFFFVCDEEKVFSPTFLPLCDDSDYTVFTNGNEVVFSNNTIGVSEKISLLSGLNGEVRLLNTHKKCKVAFYSSVVLNTDDGYISHPVFNGLFVSAQADGNILILKKRRRSQDDKDLYIGVRVEGLKDLQFECNAENFIGARGSLKSPKIFSDEKTAPSLGDVLNPCLGFWGETVSDYCAVAILYSENYDELLNTLHSLPNTLYSYALLSDNKNVLSSYTDDILGELLYVPYPQKQLNNVVVNGKIADFQSKTCGKKIILYKFNENELDNFRAFLHILNDLKLLGIEAKPYIEVKNDIEEEKRTFVINAIANAHIACEVVFEKENISQFAFLTINSNLQYKRTKFSYNILFDIERKVEENYRFSDLSTGSVLYRSGCGGFDENDNYIVDKLTLLPYSNLICGENGGMLITDNGGGFFYFGNSRENKMSRFSNDPVIDDFSEFLYAKTPAGVHRLNSGIGKNRFAVFEKGKTVFVSKINGLTCTVKYTTLCNGFARAISVDAINNGGYVEFLYGLMPALNWRFDLKFCAVSRMDNLFTITNLQNGNRLFIKIISEKMREISFGEDSRIPYFEYLATDDEIKFSIVFSQDENLLKSINIQNLAYYEEKDVDYFNNLGNVDIVSRYRSFNILTRWLPYQIVSSRVNGKLGFYQVGGANGFRDRLQDSLAIMHFMPEKTREIIIDSAKHQYIEGDVMHWWHNPKFGLRSKITDDKLFLPLVTAEYVSFTGDYAILDMELPYLDSRPLDFEEKSRYENPPYTNTRESLLKHCLKAIKSSLRYGEHGLLVMGTGDWNDGMDEICAMGKGESVFNSMLAYEVLQKISVFCPEEQRKELLRIAEELNKAINTFAFEKDRYMRLYSDDGIWYGCEGNSVLKLDLLTQSYAVLSGVAGERGNTVLNTAEKLIDKKAGIIKLLEPPLTEKSKMGYISAYPEGVRENGGQYTHASIWYLIALTRIGRQDDAFELFMMMNPIEKQRNEEGINMYKGEPFVLSGDVYSNGQNYGRMGWSWYTGSASWAYRLIVEEFYGLKRQGKKLYINPHLPKKLSSSVLTYRYGESLYSIEYRLDEKFSMEINGVPLVENYITLENGTLKKVKVTVP